jgi:hypothetical protein
LRQLQKLEFAALLEHIKSTRPAVLSAIASATAEASAKEEASATTLNLEL